ncbi:TNF receptor-associated factor family protein DDB_G0272098-like [Mytilus trossulus]|uniref:TNF receptor-associated factor family protein DDB_G0272098-like n=1 Tax=Mytilus trossulus TaxID=6551 RepID=UPI003006B6B3
MGCASSADTGTEFIQFEKKKPLNNDNAVVITPRPSSFQQKDQDNTSLKTKSENSDLSLSPSTDQREREDTILKTETPNSNPSPIDKKDREDTMPKSEKSDMSEHNRPPSQYVDDSTNIKQDYDRPQSFHQSDHGKKSPDKEISQSRESSGRTKDVMIVNTTNNEEKERKPSSSSSSSSSSSEDEGESDDDKRDSDTRLLETRDSETRFMETNEQNSVKNSETNDLDDNRGSEMNGYTPIGSETNDHKSPDSETNERKMNDDGISKTGDAEKDEADVNLNNFVGTEELTKPVEINETTEIIQPEEKYSNEEGAANDNLTKTEEVESTHAVEGESVDDTETKAEPNDTRPTEKRDNESSENGLISSKEVDSTENNSEKSPQGIDHTEEEDMPFT